MSTTTLWAAPQPRQAGFWHVFTDPLTYTSFAYLLLGLPLGTAYFVFLVTGISLGLGLAVTLLGIPILLGVFAASWWLGAWERSLANALLDARLPATREQLPRQRGLLAWCKALLTSGTVWKRVAYLFARFPLGILSFSLGLSVALVPWYLIFLPLYYRWTNFYYYPYQRVTTLAGAFVFVPIGLALVPLSLWAIRGMGIASRAFARALLA